MTIRPLDIIGAMLLVAASFCWSSPTSAVERRTNTFWAHGTILQPETGSKYIGVKPPFVFRKGGGAIVIWKGQRYFDLPLATPAILENTDNTIVEAYLLFKALEGARVISVEVWDGNTLLRQYSKNLSGDFSAISKENTFRIGKNVHMGITVRVGVDFGNATLQDQGGEDLKGPQFQVHAAGAQFLRFWSTSGEYVGKVGGSPK